jgi:hypothetical protein
MNDRTAADPRRPEPAGQVIEIACDESGSEGEKLVGGNTEVFAHASVRLAAESAAECIQEMRSRAPSPTLEYKSDVIRRAKHRRALMWLLGPSGPLLGNAHVHLVEKAFLVVARVVDLLLAEAGHARGAVPDRDRRPMAVALYREGRRTCGDEEWNAVLRSLNELMRGKNGRAPETEVPSALRAIDTLDLIVVRSGSDELRGLLRRSRSPVDVLEERLLSHRDAPLDPLIPAIVHAVFHWGAEGDSVSIVHDRQNLLTERRVALLKEISGGPRSVPPSRGGLAGLRLVDSRSDPRVQVADLLAGAARKIAEDELNDRGDAELTALLRPYVDSSSIWGDDRSWSVLKPPPGTRS